MFENHLGSRWAPKRARDRPGGRICDAGYYFVYVECTALRRERRNGPKHLKTCIFLYVYVDDRYEAKNDDYKIDN